MGAVGALELIISNVDAFSVVECSYNPFLVAFYRVDSVAVGQISNDVGAATVVMGYSFLMPALTVIFEAGKY